MSSRQKKKQVRKINHFTHIAEKWLILVIALLLLLAIAIGAASAKTSSTTQQPNQAIDNNSSRLPTGQPLASSSLEGDELE
jgi:ABC-type oligopeptide transport system substrate-binding subunit